MKKLLLVVILLVFLAGGGAAAWWFLLREVVPDTAAETAPTAKPAFVTLDTMAVPAIRADGTIQTFVIELALELPDEAAVEPVTKMLPKLADRLMVTLHELLGRRFTEESGYDQVMIKDHLLRVARKVAGDELITAVVIKNLEEFRR